MARPLAIILAFIAATVANAPIRAQDPGTLNPVPLPPLSNPKDPATPAKELFGRALEPAPMTAQSIGGYARGCLAGAVPLPINGQTWQVMRLSRDRNWGHPNLIRFLERLANKVPTVAGWPGLLVGDMSQPRGGPMLTGHASHQIGLDADIWLTPMPTRQLTVEEREMMSATDVVDANHADVDPKVWTPQHGAVIRAAAEDHAVERIFVNPAIKKALCREAGNDRGWLEKVRPWFGHNYHFHVRIHCPADDPGCHGQPPPTGGDGCGSELSSWFIKQAHPPKPGPPPRPLRMADLPPACHQVLTAR